MNKPMVKAASEGRSGQSDARRVVFAVGFAFAAVFHALGNIRLAPAWAYALLGLAAAGVLLRPRRRLPLTLLSLAVLLTAWLEAPVLGNHWFLAALIAAAWLLRELLVLTGRWDDEEGWARFVGAARTTLLIAYGFAAFAKLNADFFDPVVSCAGFFLRESAGSVGLGRLVGEAGSLAGQLAGYGTAGTELAIPILLFFRRTRAVGVIVGIAFHFLLAIDRAHQFFDFSSLLTVLFLLFASEEVNGALIAAVARLSAATKARWSSAPELGRTAIAATAALLLMLPLGPADWSLSQPVREVGLVVFWVGGALVLGIVTKATWDSRRSPLCARIVPLGLGVLAVVPVLALVNGLTPYTEIKTAAGWNMYSNLRTVGGDSNHFIVRATLPLRSEQDDPVEILDSSDPALVSLRNDQYSLTYNEFRDHLSERPGVAVTFKRKDTVIEVPKAVEQPDLIRRQSLLERKFLHFRPIDDSDTERCLPSFGPVR